MNTKLNYYFSKIVYLASKPLQLPYVITFVLRLVNMLQIMSLVHFDSTALHQKEANTFAKSVGKIISSVKSFVMLSQFSSEGLVTSTAYIFCCYISLIGCMILYFVFQISRGKRLSPRTSNLFAFSSMIHSQILFYPIHCFFIRTIKLNLSCQGLSGTYFYCGRSWIIVPSLAIIFNLAYGLIKELYCYQIRNQKGSCSVKGNLYPLVVFTQKAAIIPLISFLDNMGPIVVILNVLFCAITHFILQAYLPFYSIKILKFEIGLNSITTLFSLLTISATFKDDYDINLILILLAPLTIKLSLLKLKVTLRNILNAPPSDPHRTTHLPILVKALLKQTLKTRDRLNKGGIYVYGFVKDHIQEIFSLDWKQIPINTETQAYMLTAKKVEGLLKIYPKNELLLFTLAELYINKLQDIPKAMNILSRIKSNNQSFPVRNSIEDFYLQLESIYHKTSQETVSNLNFLNYFEYREQTGKLKKLIQKEVIQQTKFWEGLNENSINIYKSITQAEGINQLQNKIEAFWQKRFQSLKREYPSCLILYGLYMEIIQDLHHIGSSLCQKAYNLVLHRSPLQENIINALIGKNAIIVASCELENPGKVIDASSSVKQLFEVDRQHLIGSNISAILPKFMAQKHTLLIQNFHKRFKYDMNFSISSYAKSFGDEYFPVQIKLHSLPYLKNGLNIVAYVKKVARTTSVIIIDYDGKILECSKDLQLLQNTHIFGGNIDLAAISPELMQAHQAFNIVYGPKQNPIDAYTGCSNQIETEALSATKKVFLNNRRETVLNCSTNTFGAKELSTNKDHEQDLGNNNILLKNTSSNVFKVEDSPYLATKKKIESSLPMTYEEAEKICNIFKEKKEIKINLSAIIHSKVSKSDIFETQIEPLFFAGSLYKVVKLIKRRESLRENLRENSSPEKQSPERKKVLESFQNKNRLVKAFEKFETGTPRNSSPVSPNTETAIQPSKEKSNEKNEESQNDNTKIGFLKPKNSSRKSKAQSVIDSNTSVRKRAKILNNIFKKEKLSYPTKLAIILVFISILVVIVSVCIDLIFSKQSLKEMDDAVDLINLTNLRLFRLLAAWRGVLILYCRSVGLRPDNSALMAQYRGVIKNSSIDMVKNNNMIRKIVDDFSNDFVTNQFFAKKISLWLPYEGRTVSGEKVDLFTANQILSDKNMYVANFPGTVFNLKNKTDAVFALNNTANDYLVAVSESLWIVQDYFEQTKKTNISLLKITLSLECLALGITFFSVVILFIIIYSAHKNLFRSLSKIKKRNIEERVLQLNRVLDYLKQDVEDMVTFYRDHESQNSSNAKIDHPKVKTDDKYYKRTYSIRNLIWNMIKYIILTLTMVCLIISLFGLSFSASIEGFKDLSRISSQIGITYEYGGQLSSILSIFYYTLIFANETSYKIRNDLPLNQMRISIDYLRDASTVLLSSLSATDKGIEDPTVESLLKNNLCIYMTAENKVACNKNTNYNSVGLLGINAKFYQTCGLPILGYIANPTAARGQKLLNDIVTILGEMHMISYDGYLALAQLLLSNFDNRIEEKKSKIYDYFRYNLTAILFMTLLIRVVVIRKYKSLDLAVRKILRLIPYEIVEKNKVIIYYLSKEFRNELSKIKNM